MLIVVSGPSGVGKNHFLDVVSRHRGWARRVPVTTRKRRPAERDGIDYEFLSVPTFQTAIRGRSLQYWDYALGNYYGYRPDVQSESEIVIIHALARMALRMREKPAVRLVYLRQSAPDVLEERLHARNASAADILRRREHWAEEEVHAALFDVVIERFDRMTDGEMLGTPLI